MSTSARERAIRAMMSPTGYPYWVISDISIKTFLLTRAFLWTSRRGWSIPYEGFSLVKIPYLPFYFKHTHL